jgi:hypothetical protein
MGKSLVMPRAASFSTIRGEVPSLSISSPFSAPVSTPSPSPGQGPAHDAGVDLNPRGAVEQWNARLGGSGDPAAGAWHGPGGAAGGESGATTRSLRYVAAGDEAEAAMARRSREIIAAMARRWQLVVELRPRGLDVGAPGETWKEKGEGVRFFFYFPSSHFLVGWDLRKGRHKIGPIKFSGID